jgi:hypothetical protein
MPLIQTQIRNCVHRRRGTARCKLSWIQVKPKLRLILISRCTGFNPSWVRVIQSYSRARQQTAGFPRVSNPPGFESNFCKCSAPAKRSMMFQTLLGSSQTSGWVMTTWPYTMFQTLLGSSQTGSSERCCAIRRDVSNPPGFESNMRHNLFSSGEQRSFKPSWVRVKLLEPGAGNDYTIGFKPSWVRVKPFLSRHTSC